jgi:hypothetical protein
VCGCGAYAGCRRFHGSQVLLQQVGELLHNFCHTPHVAASAWRSITTIGSASTTSTFRDLERDVDSGNSGRPGMLCDSHTTTTSSE